MSLAWDLKGRPATASIYPDQREQIVRSQAWLQVSGKPLMWVVERCIDIERVGFFVGPTKLPELFSCLVVRILQITPKPEIVFALVEQDVHKYLRVLGAVVIRLIGNQHMFEVMLQICFEDYRNIRVQHCDTVMAVVPLDVLCEQLAIPPQSEEDGAADGWLWFGLKLAKRIPQLV